MEQETEKNADHIEELTKKPKKNVCKYCALKLPTGASVCSKCGRDQKAWRNHFRIDHIGLVIALLAIFLGYLQFREARLDRKEASEALKIAQGIEQSVIKLDSVINKAESELDELQSLSEFSLTVAQANNDNRQAFDKLLEMSKNNDQLKQLAIDAIARIVTEVDPLINLRVDPKPDWKKYGITVESATFEELTEVYNNIHPNFRPHVLSTIWSQERFSECKRLSFLARVIKEDQSLRALHRACILMNNYAKINMNILGADLYLKWWEGYKAKCNE